MGGGDGRLSLPRRTPAWPAQGLETRWGVGPELLPASSPLTGQGEAGGRRPCSGAAQAAESKRRVLLDEEAGSPLQALSGEGRREEARTPLYWKTNAPGN